MKITKEYIERNIDYINKAFPYQDLRYKSKQRERLSNNQLTNHVLSFAFEEIDCINKIFYGKGQNAYYYFVPTGFWEFLQDVEIIRTHARLNALLPRHSECHSRIKI